MSKSLTLTLRGECALLLGGVIGALARFIENFEGLSYFLTAIKVLNKEYRGLSL